MSTNELKWREYTGEVENRSALEYIFFSEHLSYPSEFTRWNTPLKFVELAENGEHDPLYIGNSTSETGFIEPKGNKPICLIRYDIPIADKIWGIGFSLCVLFRMSLSGEARRHYGDIPGERGDKLLARTRERWAELFRE